MRNLFRAVCARFRRAVRGRTNTRHVLKLPDECVVDIMLFVRRADVDTASITCRYFRHILTRVALQLPLRHIYQLRLVSRPMSRIALMAWYPRMLHTPEYFRPDQVSITKSHT